jgi:peptidoglycan/xylan/chitin deacetylase (PgdA/CDA1 family)
VTGVILMYHRVAEPIEDAYSLAVSPQRFTEHVEHLARRGGVVPLAEIAQPADTLKIAITFDDGYADNATRAAPELAAASLPVTYFVTTGRLGGQHFWWDRLSTGLLGAQPRPQGIDVTVGDRSLWLALNDLQAARTSLRFLHRRLRPLPPDELAATVDDLLHRLGATEPPADDCTMTVEQLHVMGQLPMVEIGAHTRTHVQLGGQSKELQRSEVIGSITDLSGVLGRPITSFAYPFGSPQAVGDLAPRLAREAGCVLACSTVHGAVRRSSDTYQLPRLNVRDWNAAELAASIDQIAWAR